MKNIPNWFPLDKFQIQLMNTKMKQNIEGRGKKSALWRRNLSIREKYVGRSYVVIVFIQRPTGIRHSRLLCKICRENLSISFRGREMDWIWVEKLGRKTRNQIQGSSFHCFQRCTINNTLKWIKFWCNR